MPGGVGGEEPRGSPLSRSTRSYPEGCRSRSGKPRCLPAFRIKPSSSGGRGDSRLRAYSNRTQSFSINMLMGTIGIFALNLAILRLAFFNDAIPVAGMFGPIGLAVQLAALAHSRRPPGSRAFLAGFISIGIAVMVATPLLMRANYDLFGGLWNQYVALLSRLLGSRPGVGDSASAKLSRFVVVAIFFAPAQLLLAFAGGCSCLVM